MAKRYGQLPSHVIRTGESIDIIISEIALGYENYMHEKAENDAKGIPTMGKKRSTKELQAMMEATRRQHGS